MPEQTQPEKDALIQAGRLLTQEEVLRMWPISREYLSRLTHHRDENKRIPSVRFGRKPLYSFEELMWYREKCRFTPKRRIKK
jgi:hypothetical protein